MNQRARFILYIVLGIFLITTVFLFAEHLGNGKRVESVSMGQEDDGIYDDTEDLPKEREDKGGITREDFPAEPEDTSEPDYDSIPGLTVCEPYREKLVEDSSTNILILGEDKEAKLFDTIGIISINKKSNVMKIIMIPRDTYVEYNKKVLHYIEKAGKLEVPGIFKINNAHNIGPIMKYEGKFKPYTSISFLADVIKEKFGIEVDDYVKINVNTFASVVDLFGGVEINVPYAMHYEDHVQDLSIHIDKGVALLDGKQAEGFVRFRQGFDENGKFFEIGDEGRKANQVAFIKAFIKQHGTVHNIDKIPELLKMLGKNVQHSIGLGDVLFKYMAMAKDAIMEGFEIESTVLSGEFKWINGSQYIVIE